MLVIAVLPRVLLWLRARVVGLRLFQLVQLLLVMHTLLLAQVLVVLVAALGRLAVLRCLEPFMFTEVAECL